MDSTTQTLTALIILLALVISVIVTQFIRRRKEAFPLRAMPAYDAIPLFVGEAIETGRPVHMSFGSAGLGGSSTALTVASAELFYQVALRASAGSTVLTMSDPSALPLGIGVMRSAYALRADQARETSVRWYPSGERSLAFAAALTGLMGDDKVSSNVLIGSYGAELALILEAAARRRQSTIAGSVDLAGQAVAYAMADRCLIGEEMFVGGAYLGEGSSQRAGVVALDMLRWLMILGILVATGNAIREPVAAAIKHLFGGG